MPSLSDVIVLGLSILSLYTIRLILKRNSKKGPFPPGPKGYPIIHNLLDIPAESPWTFYAELGKEYGDIIFLRAFNQPLLVLNSQKRIKDLLDKRSLIYSGRPYSTMIIELLDWGSNHGVLDSTNPRWKRQRKIFHQMYNASVVSRYHPIVRKHVHRLLGHLLNTPGDQHSLRHHTVGAILMNVAYGFDPKTKEDPYIAEALGMNIAFQTAITPGRFLVDQIPLLKYVPSWMPGAEFKRFAEYYREVTYRTLQSPFKFAMDGMKRNEVQPCALTSMVETLPDADDPNYAQIKEDLVVALGISYAGGVDTINGTLSNFLVAIAMHHQAQEKAQAELDRVVGTSRLPDFADREDLVYVRALTSEVMRWQLIAPLGLPQKLMENDFYDGYFIPKGTIVMPNAWAVLHDPEVFENPSEFIPERYIKDGKLNNDLLNPLHFAFGFGRRVCPGREIALEVLYLTIASILSVFEVSPPKDETGAFIKVEPSYTPGAIPIPKPFEVVIRPRSTTSAQIIRSPAE